MHSLVPLTKSSVTDVTRCSRGAGGEYAYLHGAPGAGRPRFHQLQNLSRTAKAWHGPRTGRHHATPVSTRCRTRPQTAPSRFLQHAVPHPEALGQYVRKEAEFWDARAIPTCSPRISKRSNKPLWFHQSRTRAAGNRCSTWPRTQTWAMVATYRRRMRNIVDGIIAIALPEKVSTSSGIITFSGACSVTRGVRTPGTPRKRSPTYACVRRWSRRFNAAPDYVRRGRAVSTQGEGGVSLTKTSPRSAAL